MLKSKDQMFEHFLEKCGNYKSSVFFLTVCAKQGKFRKVSIQNGLNGTKECWKSKGEINCSKWIRRFKDK